MESYFGYYRIKLGPKASSTVGGKVGRAFGFAGNRTLFRELNYLGKATSLVYEVWSGDVELMQ